MQRCSECIKVYEKLLKFRVKIQIKPMTYHSFEWQQVETWIIASVGDNIG